MGLPDVYDQVAHVGLVGLEVQRFARCLSHQVAKVQVMLQLGLHAVHVLGRISRALQFVGRIRPRSDQRHHGLVHRHTLWFPLLQVRRDLGVATEVVDVVQVALRR